MPTFPGPHGNQFFYCSLQSICPIITSCCGLLDVAITRIRERQLHLLPVLSLQCLLRHFVGSILQCESPAGQGAANYPSRDSWYGRNKPQMTSFSLLSGVRLGLAGLLGFCFDFSLLWCGAIQPNFGPVCMLGWHLNLRSNAWKVGAFGSKGLNVTLCCTTSRQMFWASCFRCEKRFLVCLPDNNEKEVIWGLFLPYHESLEG